MKLKEYDYTHLSAVSYDSETRPKNVISNPTISAVIKLEDDEDLRASIQEVMAIDLSYDELTESEKYILQHIYKKQDLKVYQLCMRYPMSESSYYRKLKSLAEKVGKTYIDIIGEIVRRKKRMCISGTLTRTKRIQFSLLKQKF